MVPLDGFATSERALAPAIRLARDTGARLHLVHVIDPIKFPPYAPAVPTAEWWNGGAIDAAKDYLDRLRLQLLLECGVEGSGTVLQGLIAPSLLHEAEQIDADLIVMTTHQRSPVQRLFVGSVAHEVARSSLCPVLFMRAAEVIPEERAQDTFKHILVPIDGSPHSETILPFARDIARVDKGQVTLLHVVMSTAAIPMVSGGFVPSSIMERVDPAAELHAGQMYVDRIANTLCDYDVRPRAKLAASTSIANEILQFAKDNSVDLIAMTTHGQGGLWRLLLGSTADRVLRASDVPVLLFNPKEDHDQSA